MDDESCFLIINRHFDLGLGDVEDHWFCFVCVFLRVKVEKKNCEERSRPGVIEHMRVWWWWCERCECGRRRRRPDLCEKLRGIFGMVNEIFGNLGRRAI